MDPWVIDWLAGREKESEQRTQPELPVPDFPIQEEENEVQSPKRGPIIIKIFGDDDDDEEEG